MARKLGRNPSPRPDLNRRLRLKHFLAAGYTGTIPAAVSYTPPVGDLPMFDNDRLGDCTAAAAGHLTTAFAMAGQGRRLVPALPDVIRFYSGSTGYRPDDSSTDQGGDMATVLKYWQKTGMAGHRVAAYFAVDANDPAELKAALYLFGNLYIGMALPESADKAFDKGQVWDYVARSKDLGGHCVAGHSVDAAGRVGISTWGGLATMTPAFVEKYCDEVYCVATQEWVRNNTTPEGLDVAGVNAAYAAITGKPGPFVTDVVTPTPQPAPTPVPGPGPAPQPAPPVVTPATLADQALYTQQLAWARAKGFTR